MPQHCSGPRCLSQLSACMRRRTCMRCSLLQQAWCSASVWAACPSIAQGVVYLSQLSACMRQRTCMHCSLLQQAWCSASVWAACTCIAQGLGTFLNCGTLWRRTCMHRSLLCQALARQQPCRIVLQHMRASMRLYGSRLLASVTLCYNVTSVCHMYNTVASLLLDLDPWLCCQVCVLLDLL